MSIEPTFRKGMLLRVSSANFSWLMRRNQSCLTNLWTMEMIQIQRDSHLTVIGDMFFENGSTFARYPVLFENQMLCIIEPSTNFHFNNGYLQILKDVE